MHAKFLQVINETLGSFTQKKKELVLVFVGFPAFYKKKGICRHANSGSALGNLPKCQLSDNCSLISILLIK